MNELAFTSADDPFVILESTSTTTKLTFTDPLEEFSKFNLSGSTNRLGSSNISARRPPPKPGQVLKSNKVKGSNVSSIDELEGFAMGRMQNNVNICSRGARERQTAKASKYKEAEDSAQKNHQKSADDLESFFGVGSRSSNVPKSRTTTSDPLFDAKINNKGEGAVAQRKSNGVSSSIRKGSSTTNIVDDFSSIFGDPLSFGEFEEVEGESEERQRARLGQHQRTQDRVRIADKVDAEMKRWAAGKEGNMRALLSSLQHVLWPECGWEPVSLTDLITSASVKKVYRKATLCVHPDKVQQKGATLEQKYTAEKVFDILEEAWNKFNKEELSYKPFNDSSC
ncbi:hypothetical protein P3X46_021407 [Hevea brasiliensis]|uniref:J domain-containing protein n=1 Tax=Hevea brasiliensis TaxID=3981 RepID=A0ABQ9LFG3_HEVBR|nr:hypothetical protein P3X46_021407 [Hevea brasiliensis]